MPSTLAHIHRDARLHGSTVLSRKFWTGLEPARPNSECDFEEADSVPLLSRALAVDGLYAAELFADSGCIG